MTNKLAELDAFQAELASLLAMPGSPLVLHCDFMARLLTLMHRHRRRAMVGFALFVLALGASACVCAWMTFASPVPIGRALDAVLVLVIAASITRTLFDARQVWKAMSSNIAEVQTRLAYLRAAMAVRDFYQARRGAQEAAARRLDESDAGA
jgi:hypothetical protein